VLIRTEEIREENLSGSLNTKEVWRDNTFRYDYKAGIKAGDMHNGGYNKPVYGTEKKAPGNGIKVFITVLSTLIPGLGQVIGAITAIVMMNEKDADRKSFGSSLLAASIIVFIITCLFWGAFCLVLMPEL